MKQESGYLEVIAGPMFSGKTEELIRRVKRAAIAKKRVQVFKHEIDTRYGRDNKVFSHNGLSFTSEIVGTASQIRKRLKPHAELIAIDEAQWFGEDLIDVVEFLLTKKKKIIISGLALTFDRKPFTPMPTLMAMADTVTKLSAICTICGEEAVFHKRITKGKTGDPKHADPSLVGRLESYEARCRRHYTIG